MYSNWLEFWGSLDSDRKQLFRLLQSTHNQLGKNVQMFCYGHMSQKRHIENYVKEHFNVDLNNLPINN